MLEWEFSFLVRSDLTQCIYQFLVDFGVEQDVKNASSQTSSRSIRPGKEHINGFRKFLIGRERRQTVENDRMGGGVVVQFIVCNASLCNLMKQVTFE